MPAKKSKSARKRTKKASSKSSSKAPVSVSVLAKQVDPVVETVVVAPVTQEAQENTPTPQENEAKSLKELDVLFNASFAELKQLIGATKLVLAEQRRIHRQAKRDVREAGKRRRRTSKKTEAAVTI